VLIGAGVAGFDGTGVALAFGAALVYTVYILVSDAAVRQVPPMTLTTLVMTGAAATLTARAVVVGDTDLGLTARGWFWIACIALVSTVVASTAFFAGLRRTGPSSASILSTFEPVATAALAAVLLEELLTPVQLLGGGLVLVSVVLVQLRRRTPRRAAVAQSTVPARVPNLG
jgi:drug/metabolite transporter (DMT)-like permease